MFQVTEEQVNNQSFAKPVCLTVRRKFHYHSTGTNKPLTLWKKHTCTSMRLPVAMKKT